ncbi:MAG: type 1 glutamine amidotransferase domain-containing protein [Polyangia bacterium]
MAVSARFGASSDCASRRGPQVRGMRNKALDGVRVAVLAADGVEQVEVTFPMRALRKAGADVRVISLRPGRIRGVNLIWRGRKFPVDDTVFNARPEDYGALYLPGGFVNPDLLRQSEQVRQFVTRFESLGRPIATMCHGPEVLISAGLARGKRLTSWPGIADDLRNAGADWHDERVVHDGKMVSSRGPHDMRAFIPAMLKLFAEHAPQAHSPLPRRTRWVAQLLRLGTSAAMGGLVWRAATQGPLSSRKFKRSRDAMPATGTLLMLLGVAGGLFFAARDKRQARRGISGLHTT